MKILIHGAAGYVGSVLTPMLVRAGHHVTALDSFMYGNETTLAALCKEPRFDLHRVDVRDVSALRPHLKNADVVIPLAGLVGAPICNLNPFNALAVNLYAPIAMFDEMSRDQLCIMPTTESSYGSNDDVCTEETPINPLSTYAQHKAEVEQALLARENSISLRLATVFGMSSRMRLDLLVNDFAWQAYKTNGILLFEEHFKRTVVHVEDVARAFLHALENRGTMQNEIYNVGNVSVSKLELCEAIKVRMAEIGKPFYYTTVPTGSDPDKRNYQVSSEKLLRTGYSFKWSLEAGLDELFKGFKALKNTVHGNV